MSIAAARAQVLSFAEIIGLDTLITATADAVAAAAAALKDARKDNTAATADARQTRRDKLVELYRATTAGEYTQLELVEQVKHHVEVEKLPMPEDFNYKTAPLVTYATVLGHLFSLEHTSKNDLPHTVVISEMHNVIKRVGKIDATKIINKPGQTIAGAWAEIEIKNQEKKDAKNAKAKATVVSQTLTAPEPDSADGITVAGHLSAADASVTAAADLLNTDPTAMTDDTRAQVKALRDRLDMLLGADALADAKTKITAPAQRVAA